MKISLIDFDETSMPNLALMKLSAWHKKQGHETDFYYPLFSKPDMIYISTVFKFNKKILPNERCDIHIGGTGFDSSYGGAIYHEKLSDEIEHICPDYNLYLNMDYSMGFITRGCIRKCGFCIVPKKEGAIRFNAKASEFQRHKKLVIMDNNILACEAGINELKEIAKTETKIDICQGLDFRLVDGSIAALISELKWIRQIRTACDSDNNFEAVKKAVELLNAKGVRSRRIFCYCLVRGEQDIPRILELDKLGIDVFAMGYMDFETGEKSDMTKKICEWVNIKPIFRVEKDFSKVKLRKGQ